MDYRQLSAPSDFLFREAELIEGRGDFIVRAVDNELPRRMGINPIRRDERKSSAGDTEDFFRP